MDAGKATVAEALLQARLAEEPANAALLCSMGDLTKQPAWYEKAWAASNQTNGRRCELRWFALLCAGSDDIAVPAVGCQLLTAGRHITQISHAAERGEFAVHSRAASSNLIVMSCFLHAASARWAVWPLAGRTMPPQPRTLSGRSRATHSTAMCGSRWATATSKRTSWTRCAARSCLHFVQRYARRGELRRGTIWASG